MRGNTEEIKLGPEITIQVHESLMQEHEQKKQVVNLYEYRYYIWTRSSGLK